MYTIARELCMERVYAGRLERVWVYADEAVQRARTDGIGLGALPPAAAPYQPSAPPASPPPRPPALPPRVLRRPRPNTPAHRARRAPHRRRPLVRARAAPAPHPGFLYVHRPRPAHALAASLRFRLVPPADDPASSPQAAFAAGADLPLPGLPLPWAVPLHPLRALLPLPSALRDPQAPDALGARARAPAPARAARPRAAARPPPPGARAAHRARALAVRRAATPAAGVAAGACAVEGGGQSAEAGACGGDQEAGGRGKGDGACRSCASSSPYTRIKSTLPTHFTRRSATQKFNARAPVLPSNPRAEIAISIPKRGQHALSVLVRY
ncbi:hypothetical protein B0H10DRAFT_1939363 [Mycena sp. CBHHK59/15]|nr:hypothetical protein B0H10DRAFT_1939363 [Mycena sp. CBHHK59/15]